MERRVLFLNKLIILAMIFSGCQQHQEAAYAYVNADSVVPQMVNGIMYMEGKPFTGIIYSLYSGTKDTAWLSGYRKGKEHGAWKKKFPGGHLRETRMFDNGEKTGEYAAWWDNGHPMLQYFFREDEYEGCCREWNRDGTLVKEMNYNKGYEQGWQRAWYDNGKIKTNYRIINGKRYGLLGTKNCVNVSDSIFKK